MDLRLVKFNPLPPTHPALGQQCPICWRTLQVGDVTTLIGMIPASDEDALKMQLGLWFTARASLLHWQCATGEGDDTD